MTSPAHTEPHTLEDLLSYEDEGGDEALVRQHMREHTSIEFEHGVTTLKFEWRQLTTEQWLTIFASRNVCGMISEDLAVILIRVYLWDKKGCLPQQKNDE